ncbi:protein FAR1-RELATED SEQUENCE 5-like [Carya illinoinensis]|uniref:protein FAR1-RELATED SEQUENCE 5-like n=1 Tax=Carya illinoinensis TaxID=32201 RepID=UPI001C7298BA|nr:protein FAR1-RELATED SEQUENCE 5-like [Carya illinoinensis]
MKPPTPINNSSSTTCRVVGSEDNRLDGGETEVPCGSPRVEANTFELRPNPTETDDGSVGTSLNVQVDDDDTTEEPKLGDDKWVERGEDESARYVTLACARGGKAWNRTLNVANPCPIGKTECKAKINALRQDGVFRLTTTHNIHNHGLDPKKSHFFRFNREISDAVKRVLDTNDLTGIRTNKSYGSLVVGASGNKNLPFLDKDCRGAGALREYFLQMQYKNLGLFYMMDIDDEGMLNNVFWVDPHSRAAYQYFGNVVTFNITYLTNQYGMPFASFVGINHREQFIFLGACLISSEDTETVAWLFETWLQCMDSIAPKTIITDQDRAMKNAIAIVFLKTWHRFCLWHKLKKVSEKLGSYGSYKTGMKNILMKCVYDSQSVDEFEKCWD